MKKVVMKNESQTVDFDTLKISDQIGFVDSDGEKGYFVYIGKRNNDKKVHHACRLSRQTSDASNNSYGSSDVNNFINVPEIGFMVTISLSIKEMYLFEDRKSLFKWLSE